MDVASSSPLERKRGLGGKKTLAPPVLLPKSQVVIEALKGVLKNRRDQARTKSSRKEPQQQHPITTTTTPHFKKPIPLPTTSSTKRKIAHSPTPTTISTSSNNMADSKDIAAATSSSNPPNITSAGPPIPKPRKKGPPSKPVPYRKHRENKVQEITTFKSNLTVQPAQTRTDSLPIPVDRKQNRISLKGEPSEKFSQPKKPAASPVECHVPVIPKRIVGETRPRLDTPVTTQDPDDIIGRGRVGEVMNIGKRPRLNTPAVPTNPVVARGSSQLANGNPSPLSRSAEKKKMADDDGDDDGDDDDDDDGYSVVVCEEKDHKDSAAYSTINLGRKESIENPSSPCLNSTPSLLPSSSHPPASSQTPPLPARNYDDTSDVAAAQPSLITTTTTTTASPLPPSSPFLSRKVPSRDEDYSTTSHVNKLSQAVAAASPGVRVGVSHDPTHPFPSPGTSEYNVISRGISQAPPPSPHNEPSRVPLPVAAAEEYSKLSGSHDPLPLVTADGYSHLDIPLGPGKPTLVPEYEVVTVEDPIPTPPTRKNRHGPSPKPSARKAPPSQGVVSGGKPPLAKDSVDSALKSGAKSKSPLPVSPRVKPTVPPPSPPTHRAARPAVPPPPTTVTKLLSSPPLPLVPVPSSPKEVSPSSMASPPPRPLVPVPPSPKETSSSSTTSSSPALSSGGKVKVPPPKPKRKPPPLTMKDKPSSSTTNDELTPSPDSSLGSGGVVFGSKKSLDSTSLSSYENQKVVDAVHERNMSMDNSGDGGDGVREGSENADIPSENLQYENQDILGNIGIPGTIGPYSVPLSPSEVFTVPQHAIPGPLNYCQVDVPPPRHLPPGTEDGNDAATTSKSESEFVVATSQIYPDNQGYFDVNISSSPSSSPLHCKDPGEKPKRVPPPPPPSGAKPKGQHPLPKEEGIYNPSYQPHATPGNADAEVSVEDIDIEICNGSGDDDVPSSPTVVDTLESLAQNRKPFNGYSEIDILPEISNPSSSLKSRDSKLPSPPPPLPPPFGVGENVSHSRSSSQDSHRTESFVSSGKTLEVSGVEDAPKKPKNSPRTKPSGVKTLPRRRPPPPPPVKVTSYGDDALSPKRTPPTQLDGVVNSGLCTLSQTSQNAYKKQQKSSKPVPSPKKKSEDIINPSPPVRQGLSASVPSPIPQNSATTTTTTTAAAATTTSSPGLTKRFIGLLKKRPSKRGKGGRHGSIEEDFTKSLSSPSSPPISPISSSLGKNQDSFDIELEDDSDEFGIYSTIPEPRAQEVKQKPVGRSISADQDTIAIKTDEDEAGYELVTSKPLTKKRNKNGSFEEKMHRSSSAEHLYEAANFNGKAKPSKSTNNSPRIPRKGDERRAMERKVLENPPELDDLPEGMDDSHLYAHVVKPDAAKRTEDRNKEEEVGEEANKEVKDSQPGDNVDLSREALGLVVTCHDEGSDDDVKYAIASSEIEHTTSGDHTYAVVQITSRKKKKASLNSEDGRGGEGGGGDVEGQSVDDGLTTPCDHASLPTPLHKLPPPPKPASRLKPVKPVPFSPKGTTPPVTIGEKKEIVPLNEEQVKSPPSQDKSPPSQDKSPSSQVKSPPSQVKSPPSQDKSLPSSPSRELNPAFPPQTNDLAKSKMLSLSSKPPSFPPPPPPSVSPPPPPVSPPLSLCEDENAYAVVLPTTKRSKLKAKARNAAPPPPPPPSDRMVHIDSVAKPVEGVVSRPPHSYASVDTSNPGTLVQGTESIPMKNHKYSSLHSENKKPKNQMRKYRTLPARGTPPPPPPTTATPTPTTQDDSAYATIQVGENSSRGQSSDSGAPQFLFSSNYASNLIRVGGSPAEEIAAEEDSDDEECYSTDWETSSNGEEEEEEERKEKPIPSPPRDKSFHIAHEILTTERTFVRGLTLLDKDFRQAVKSANNAHEKPAITEDNLKQILGNVGSILALNSGFLDELEIRMKSWEEKPLIGDILLGRAPYFKIYTEYISRFDTALKTLEDQKRNPLFSNVLQEFESQRKCANIPLAGYMLDVVQRITRYKLLFADYVKHLPDNSQDRIPSEKALVIISQVATHVNETIRQMDNFRKVVEVRKKLVGDSSETLITPSRKLLKEGELIKFSRKEKQLRMFFLFNDILIYASAIPPTNTTYRVIKKIPLEGMKVDLLDDPDVRHAFQIISTCKSFRLEASSEKERLKWFETFERAIKELNEKAALKQKSRLSQMSEGSDETDTVPMGSFAPPWLPDSSVSMCQLCSFNFTMTRRRHHCRACGMIFCSDCSGYFAPLKYKNNKIGRVCQACFEKLTESGSDSTDRSPMKKVRSLSRTKQVSLPSVLREIRARDQSAQISGYLHSSTSKHRWWKKRWFVVYDLVLYEFERHEDVSAKRSVTLPSYQVISPIPNHDDLLVFCLKHAGTGKEYFKTETEEQLERWVEVLRKAVVGEMDVSVPSSCASNCTSGSNTSSSTSLPSSSPSPQDSQPSLPPTHHLSPSSPSSLNSQHLPPHNEEENEEEEDDGGKNEDADVLCNGDSNNIAESSS